MIQIQSMNDHSNNEHVYTQNVFKLDGRVRNRNTYPFNNFLAPFRGMGFKKSPVDCAVDGFFLKKSSMVLRAGLWYGSRTEDSAQINMRHVRQNW